MNFVEFERMWGEQGAFSIYQVRSWCPTFNRNNLKYWIDKGYLVRLRNGWYAFADALQRPEFARFVAGRIYYPSYISLETALCAYDIIPEAVVDITSVTAKKTNRFDNAAGHFFYYSLKPELMFGYKPVATVDKQYYFLALPEKAILDFLYLHPEYTTEQDMLELRFDEVFMYDDFNVDRFHDYLSRFGSKTLTSRSKTLLSIYGL